MERNWLFNVGVGLLFSLSVGSTHAVTIDFDNSPAGALPPQTELSNQYESLGVLFTAFDGETPRSTYVLQDYVSPGGGNYWSNSDPQSNDIEILRVDFSVEIFSVSFDYMSSWGDRAVSFFYYDDSGVLLGSQAVNTGLPWDTWAPVAFTSNTNPIAYVELAKPIADDLYEWFFAIDNLTFDDPDASQQTTPVPMLGHWMKLMMVLLLAGVGILFTNRPD